VPEKSNKFSLNLSKQKKKQRKRFKNFWVIFYMSELSFNFFYFISFFQKALKNSNYCVYVRIIHCKDN
jgi:hypothetical protein